MEEKLFTVSKIEGEYAYLKPIDNEEEVFIALALLPPGVDIGSVLKYEYFSFVLAN